MPSDLRELRLFVGLVFEIGVVVGAVAAAGLTALSARVGIEALTLSGVSSVLLIELLGDRVERLLESRS